MDRSGDDSRDRNRDRGRAGAGDGGLVRRAANRKRMDHADRAKQFMPFSALKGYKEALIEREKIIVPKIELSEEESEKLDLKLRQVKKNDIVTVVYFKDDEYLKVTGMVSRFDITARIIKIVNTKIGIDDILDISGDAIKEND